MLAAFFVRLIFRRPEDFFFYGVVVQISVFIVFFQPGRVFFPCYNGLPVTDLYMIFSVILKADAVASVAAYGVPVADCKRRHFFRIRYVCALHQRESDSRKIFHFISGRKICPQFVSVNRHRLVYIVDKSAGLLQSVMIAVRRNRYHLFIGYGFPFRIILCSQIGFSVFVYRIKIVKRRVFYLSLFHRVITVLVSERVILRRVAYDGFPVVSLAFIFRSVPAVVFQIQFRDCSVRIVRICVSDAVNIKVYVRSKVILDIIGVVPFLVPRKVFIPRQPVYDLQGLGVPVMKF